MALNIHFSFTNVKSQRLGKKYIEHQTTLVESRGYLCLTDLYKLRDVVGEELYTQDVLLSQGDGHQAGLQAAQHARDVCRPAVGRPVSVHTQTQRHRAQQRPQRARVPRLQ